MKSHKSLTYITIILFFVSAISCEDDVPACEENMTGDIIITNNYVETETSIRTIHVFVDSSPLSSNTPGDYIVQAGESTVITLRQGLHIVSVYIDFGGSGAVMRELLDDREIDLDPCDEVPLNYAIRRG